MPRVPCRLLAHTSTALKLSCYTELSGQTLSINCQSGPSASGGMVAVVGRCPQKKWYQSECVLPAQVVTPLPVRSLWKCFLPSNTTSPSPDDGCHPPTDVYHDMKHREERTAGGHPEFLIEGNTALPTEAANLSSSSLHQLRGTALTQHQSTECLQHVL